jgi:hypothetical protein
LEISEISSLGDLGDLCDEFALGDLAVDLGDEFVLGAGGLGGLCDGLGDEFVLADGGLGDLCDEFVLGDLCDEFVLGAGGLAGLAGLAGDGGLGGGDFCVVTVYSCSFLILPVLVKYFFLFFLDNLCQQYLLEHFLVLLLL